VISFQDLFGLLWVGLFWIRGVPRQINHDLQII
jgi:hypothetical protein